MPNNSIPYDTNTPGGALVLTGIKQLQLGAECLARANAMLTVTDAAAVPSNIETGNAQSGQLFSVAPGSGAAFVTAVQSVATALTVANRTAIAQLTRG